MKVYAASDVHIQPFVVEQYDFYLDDTGQERVSMYYNVSRREDGSKLMVQRSPVDGGVTRRVNFANGDVVMVNDSVRSRFAARLADIQIAGKKQRLLNPPHSCLWEGEMPLGGETLAGQRTVKVSNPVIDAALGRWIEWRLLDYQCEGVQTEIQRRESSSAPWVTKQGKRMSAFTQRQPDISGFENWLQHDEVTPTEMKRRLAKLSGKTPELCPKCYSEEKDQDAKYFSQKPQNPLLRAPKK